MVADAGIRQIRVAVVVTLHFVYQLLCEGKVISRKEECNQYRLDVGVVNGEFVLKGSLYLPPLLCKCFPTHSISFHITCFRFNDAQFLCKELTLLRDVEEDVKEKLYWETWCLLNEIRTITNRRVENYPKLQSSEGRNEVVEDLTQFYMPWDRKRPAEQRKTMLKLWRNTSVGTQTNVEAEAEVFIKPGSDSKVQPFLEFEVGEEPGEEELDEERSPWAPYSFRTKKRIEYGD